MFLSVVLVSGCAFLDSLSESVEKGADVITKNIPMSNYGAAGTLLTLLLFGAQTYRKYRSDKKIGVLATGVERVKDLVGKKEYGEAINEIFIKASIAKKVYNSMDKDVQKAQVIYKKLKKELNVKKES